MNFSGFEVYLPVFVRGIGYTLALSGASIALGLLLTLVLYAGLSARLRLVRIVFNLGTEAVRLCPPLVVLIWIYYAMPAAGLPALSSGVAATAALGLYFAVFGAEILRGATATIPSSLWDTEVVYARSRIEFYLAFVVPDLFRRTFPAMNAQVVSAIKNSSLASVIAVPELTYTASLVATEIVRPFEVYTALAAGYVVTIAPLVITIRWSERSRAVALEPSSVAGGR